MYTATKLGKLCSLYKQALVLNMEVLARSCGFQKMLNLNCKVFKTALIIKYKHLVSSYHIEHYAELNHKF